MIRPFVTLFITALLAAPLSAIIVRHDRDTTLFVVQDSDFPALFHLFLTPRGYRECVATVIEPGWALTAGHCAGGIERRGGALPHPVSIAGVDNAVTAIHRPERRTPDGRPVDIALLELEKPVEHVAPLPFLQRPDQVGDEIVVVGWGDHGTGLTGPTGNDKALRRAENRVDSIDDLHMKFRFDDPEAALRCRWKGSAAPETAAVRPSSARVAAGGSPPSVTARSAAGPGDRDATASPKSTSASTRCATGSRAC